VLPNKMLCQRCKKKEALIHLNVTGSSSRQKHYCRDCADAYFARTPGMNPSRNLVKLSDYYRNKLYDELESQSPEVFDNSTTEACVRGSDLMRRFLRKRLAQDNIRLNKDGFEMLCHDLFTTHHFYDRGDRVKAKLR
jgi:hypothetical protein